MSRGKEDYSAMFTHHMTRRESPLIAEQQLARLNLVKDKYRDELTIMAQLVSTLKPKAPYRTYRPPVQTNEGYFCHFDNTPTLVKAVATLFGGGGFTADKNHIVLATPNTNVLEVKKYSEVIKSKKAVALLEEDPRIQLYIAASRVLQGARVNNLSLDATVFLLAEGFQEIVGEALYPNFV